MSSGIYSIKAHCHRYQFRGHLGQRKRWHRHCNPARTVLATNSGTISANGVSGIGIKSFQDANLTNFGIISAGDGGRGVFSLRDATVADAGTIAASSTGVAIQALRNAAVTNSGLIRANDTGGSAIAATLTADVNNSGLVLGNLIRNLCHDRERGQLRHHFGQRLQRAGDPRFSGCQRHQLRGHFGHNRGHCWNFCRPRRQRGQFRHHLVVGPGTGIGADRDANVFNSGTILADGTSGTAIIATRDANVTNSGVIAANGPSGVAIIGLQNAYVINSGII